MFRPYFSLISLLIILNVIPALAQEDLPPPLGYAALNEYDARYHVYDFKTHAVQTVERAVPLGENINDYGSSTPPALVKLQSPYDPLIQFEFESTQTPEPDDISTFAHYRRSTRLRRLVQSGNLSEPKGQSL